jgi:hypothetical protein
MTRRHDILTDDTTTSDGVVKSGNLRDHVGARHQAYEGDSVWCPVCKSMGRIVCVGARLPMKGPDGREAALSDDLCLCLCEPSPRLIASQSSSYTDS